MTNTELSDWLAAHPPEDHCYKSHSGHRHCDELNCADRGPAYYKEQALMVAIMLDAMSAQDCEYQIEGPDPLGRHLAKVISPLSDDFDIVKLGESRYAVVRAAAESVAAQEKTHE